MRQALTQMLAAICLCCQYSAFAVNILVVGTEAYASSHAVRGNYGFNSVKRMAGAGNDLVDGGVLGSILEIGKLGLAATVAGTVAGLFLGSEIGASLDRADNVC